MAKLDDRKNALENEFDNLNEEKKTLVENGKKIQQRINEINARQLQIQGAFQEINTLISDAKDDPEKKIKAVN